MTHGKRNARVYRVWCWMLGRCRKVGSHYHRRGIAVCERWQAFENFLSDMGEPPTAAHSIDRIDNDGDYEPGNCRWADRKTQARNTSSNTWLDHAGESKTIAEWSEITGIRPTTICRRLYVSGWSVDRALTTPVAPRLDGKPWIAHGMSRSAWYRARRPGL